MSNKIINKDTAHRWAHQIGTFSKVPGGRLYFNGDTIYSYGSHFPIARHVTLGKGENRRSAILFTTRDHSNTTSRHKHEVRRAIPSGVTVFYVDNVRAGEQAEYYPKDAKAQHAHNLKLIADEISATALKFQKARVNKDGYAGRIDSLISQYNGYIQFFKLRTKKIDNTDLAAVIGDLAAAADRARKAEIAKAHKEQKEREKKNAESIHKWLTGEPVQFPWSVDRIYLRSFVLGSDKVIESSRNAYVPYDEAKRTYDIITKLRARREAFVANGREIKVGDYSVKRIDPDGTVVIGCHVIKFEELHDLAVRCNWIDAEAERPDEPAVRETPNS